MRIDDVARSRRFCRRGDRVEFYVAFDATSTTYAIFFITANKMKKWYSCMPICKHTKLIGNLIHTSLSRVNGLFLLSQNKK